MTKYPHTKKNKTTSVKKNYLYNTFYQILTLITPLITSPYVSRILGSKGLGIYSFTNSIVTYFTLFAALGTYAYGQREIAMNRDDPKKSSELFWEIEILSIATTGVSTAAWVIWILLSTQYTVYYIVLTMTLVAVAFDISWYFAGFEQFKYIVIRNTIVKLLGIVLLFLLVRTKNDTIVYVGIMAATGLLGNLSMWTYIPKMLVKVDILSLHPFKRHLKQTFAYFIPTIATSVYTVLDKTMIGAITGSESENGYYEQATKIVRMIESLLFSLNTVMRSRQSYLYAEEKYDEIKCNINKSFDFLYALALPLVFGLAGIANNFVPWFFGKGFEPVVKVIYAMCALPVVICVSNVLDFQYLTPSGQKARTTRGIIAGAVSNFVLNSLMIPKYGAIGAAIASVIAETIISIIFVFMSGDFFNCKTFAKMLYKKLIASIIMFVVVAFIGYGHSGSITITFVQILCGVLVYFICLFVLRDSFARIGLRYIKEKLHLNGR